MKSILLFIIFCSLACTTVNAQEINDRFREDIGVKVSYTFTFHDYAPGETFGPQGIQKRLGDEWARSAVANPAAYHLSSAKPNFLITFEGTEVVNFFQGTWRTAFYAGNVVYVDHKRAVRVFYPH